MITIPSTATFPSVRVYEDSAAPDIAYLDLLEPAPVQDGRVARWYPMPGEMAYLAGEIRFGPGAEGFGDLENSFADRRLMPMPWNISPVYVWYRDGERSRVLAQGKTSGFGASNAIFNGTAPLSALISPLRIGAELSCTAQVTVRVRGTGDPESVLAALNDRTAEDNWDASLGETLMARFADLLKRGALTIAISDGGVPADILDGLQQQILLEWAHRFRTQYAEPVTLAWPASARDELSWSLPEDLDISWDPMDTVVLREVRILRCSQLE